MKIFVLSCEWDGEFIILGVYTSLLIALDAISNQYLEEDEVIEDFDVINGQHSIVYYTNMTAYRIDKYILEGIEK